MAGRGELRRSRRLRLGWMRHGELCYGEAVEVGTMGSVRVRRLRRGKARRGEVRRVVVWRFRKGMFGSVSGGLSRHGGLGIVRRGRVRYVWMRLGGCVKMCCCKVGSA